MPAIHELRTIAILAVTLGLAACAAPQRPASVSGAGVASPAPACAPQAQTCVPCACDQPGAQPGDKPDAPPKPAWTRAGWSQLTSWNQDRPEEAWRAFLASCGALKRQPAWARVCAEADTTPILEARGFFERNLTPWRMSGASTSLITGYYEPLLTGSRTRKAPYLTPLYAAPPDLLTIDLGDVRPDLKGQRLRGRLDGNRVVPYYDRAAIDSGQAPVAGRELVYVRADRQAAPRTAIRQHWRRRHEPQP